MRKYTSMANGKGGKGHKREAGDDHIEDTLPPRSKRKKKECGGADEHREPEVDCNKLKGKKMWRNFKEACSHYKFPGSHQVGSYGPKGNGIVRTYSNATPGKDKILAEGSILLYRLKDDKCRAQFNVNLRKRKTVQVFRKVLSGVMELGSFVVEGFVDAGANDQPTKFGREFVRFVKTTEESE